MIYKGTFNWYGQVMTFHTTTTSKKKAYSNLLAQLAYAVGFHIKKVRPYFDKDMDNYRIDEVENKGEKDGM